LSDITAGRGTLFAVLCLERPALYRSNHAPGAKCLITHHFCLERELLPCVPEGDAPLPIARITGQGLLTMGLAVAALWGCLVGQHMIVHNAAAQQAQALREIRQLRQRRFRSEPVRTPLLAPRRLRPVAG
jgi:hypothetical protein